MKKIVISLIVVFAISAVSSASVYVAYDLLYHKNELLYGTKINNIDVGYKDTEQVEKLLVEELKTYNLELKGVELSDNSITADEIDLKCDYSEELGKVFSKKPTVKERIKSMFGLDTGKCYEVKGKVTYNNEKLESIINNIKVKESKMKSKDAYLEYDEKSEEFIIIPEQQGNEIVKEELIKNVSKAIKNLNTEENLVDSCKKPKVVGSDAELSKLRDKANSYLNKITIDFGDRKEVITKNMIGEWINFDKNKIKFNDEAIREYVIGLSEKYDTFGKKREFETHSGKTVNINLSTYGWMIRRDYTVNEIVKTIKKGKSAVIEPIYSYKAYSREKDDIGGSYIEVSISEQHVWVYKDYKNVFDTACVTGNVSSGTGTPVGIHPIAYKAKGATLTGSNNSYETFVNYWMPFYDGCGFHDATWRSNFGGSIYKYNGSHGCVNLPLSSAKNMYSLIEAGEAVILY